MTEATLMIDSFKKNVVLRGEQAILKQLYNLVVMPKGTDIYNPDKGCDIMNAAYYRSTTNTDLSSLEQTIKNQIRKYSSYDVSTVKCTTVKKGDKWYLCVIFSILPMTDPYIIISNGAQARVSKFRNPSEKLKENII